MHSDGKGNKTALYWPVSCEGKVLARLLKVGPGIARFLGIRFANHWRLAMDIRHSEAAADYSGGLNILENWLPKKISGRWTLWNETVKWITEKEEPRHTLYMVGDEYWVIRTVKLSRRQWKLLLLLLCNDVKYDEPSDDGHLETARAVTDNERNIRVYTVLCDGNICHLLIVTKTPRDGDDSERKEMILNCERQVTFNVSFLL
jgi:hypothetical protein